MSEELSTEELKRWQDRYERNQLEKNERYERERQQRERQELIPKIIAIFAGCIAALVVVVLLITLTVFCWWAGLCAIGLVAFGIFCIAMDWMD